MRFEFGKDEEVYRIYDLGFMIYDLRCFDAFERLKSPMRVVPGGEREFTLGSEFDRHGLLADALDQRGANTRKGQPPSFR